MLIIVLQYSTVYYKIAPSRYYALAVVVVPVLFYVPKFFEVRSEEVSIPYTVGGNLILVVTNSNRFYFY